jgi:hypothetical protein
MSEMVAHDRRDQMSERERRAVDRRSERAARRERDDGAHVLPRWVNFIQDNLFLTFLILAEAYLLGTLMTLGWVADIEAPSRWGTYHGLGVVLFFFAGAMAAGVALRCSVAAAAAFKRRELGFALFNFLGLVVFSGAEIWASLSERSANLRPTPADTAVLQLLGVSDLPVSPTVVVVALLLPFASLYYGFSQQVRRRYETEEERAAKYAEEQAALERRVLRAQKMAEVRAAQAAGVAAALRASVQAARGEARGVPRAVGESAPQRSSASVGEALSTEEAEWRDADMSGDARRYYADRHSGMQHGIEASGEGTHARGSGDSRVPF